MIEAVTFDFWWTLYDGRTPESDDWRVAQFAQRLAAAGCPRPPERLAAAVQAMRRAHERLQEEEGLDWTPADQLQRCLQDVGATVPDDPELLRIWTTPLLVHPPSPLAGVRAVLTELTSRYRLAVICNTGTTPGDVLREVLARDGMLACFHTTIFSNEQGVAKPNPEIYRKALAALDVAPAAAVHVGDNPRTDVAGARAAGLRAVWFDSHPTGAAAPADDGIIYSLPELLPLLARL